MQPVSRTSLKLWHLLALLTTVWIVPTFLPDAVMQKYTFYILIVWAVLYVVLSRTMRTMMRLTTTDVILIERFFILLSFVVPLVYGIFYGLRNGFDVFLQTFLVADLIITGLLVLGIVIHIKSAGEYYHGVKKDKLFE